MTEVRVYDRELFRLGVVDNYTSLLWTRRFYESGEFELHTPITDENLSLMKIGNVISIKDAMEAGIIENLEYNQSSDTREIVATGRFLSSYLDRRLIKGTYYANNKAVEVAMREIITNMTKLPLLELGDLNGYTEKVSFQATYKNVLTYISKLSTSANIGFRIRPDFSAKKMYFETYKGADRTRSQHENNHVEFSSLYNNLPDTEYSLNTQDYKNVYYIGGQGEGSDRTIVIVGDDSATGFDRYEGFSSNSDISPDDITNAEYLALLTQRGNEQLDEHQTYESFDLSISGDSNFKYRTDFDLGDIVTVEITKWGIKKDLRITEITEIYETPVRQIQLTVGLPMPTSVDWSDET